MVIVIINGYFFKNSITLTNSFSDETKVYHDIHNTTITIHQCNKVHCFEQPLKYEIPTAEILELISSSEYCYQDIWFSCFSTKLTKQAAWKDRHGTIQEYFSHKDKNICDCYNKNSCFSVLDTNYCNCDTGDIVKREDLVRVTDKVL